jgi:cysteinyl-tRNA synthetase
VLRFFLLSSHYRGPINYSSAQLAQADETLAGLYRALKGAPAAAGGGGSASAYQREVRGRFDSAMDDDFNTPDAMAVVQSVARDLNIAKAAGDTARARDAADVMLSMGRILGLFQQDPEIYLKRGLAAGGGLSDADVEEQLSARRRARAAKNFAESDRIRDELTAAGILLEDKPGGVTQWRRA